LENPYGNGRIIIDKYFEEIVEEKDCNDKQKSIKLVNVGIYLATIPVLLKYIPRITSNNASNEYYLTDIVKLYKQDGNIPTAYILDKSKSDEIVNINTSEQLYKLNI